MWLQFHVYITSTHTDTICDFLNVVDFILRPVKVTEIQRKFLFIGNN